MLVQPAEAPPAPTDELFVTDVRTSLGGQTHWNSTLSVQVDIPRVVGRLSSAGTLAEPARLKTNHVIEPYARLTVCMFDVDDNSPSLFPERDRIRVNGVDIGANGSPVYASGVDGRWSTFTVNVPIEILKFGKLVGPVDDPNPSPAWVGENTISIDVDESGTQTWATSVAWASIEIRALYPVVLIPGNGNDGSWYAGVLVQGALDFPWSSVDPLPADEMFIAGLLEMGIPHDYSSATGYRSLTEAASYHRDRLPKIAARFGVNSIHLVAHSKGGVDLRAYLESEPTVSSPRVLSLTTLSTPHLGSRGADYGLWLATLYHWDEFDAGFVQVITHYFAGDQLHNQGRYFVSVEYLRDWSPKNLGMLPVTTGTGSRARRISYNSLSADANIDQSVGPEPIYDPFRGDFAPTIRDTPTVIETGGFPKHLKYEVIGTGGEASFDLTEHALTLAYRFLYYDDNFEVQYNEDTEEITMPEGPGTRALKNDLDVTTESADFPDPYGRLRPTRYGHFAVNHQMLGSKGFALKVFEIIQGAQPLTWD